MVVKTSLHVSHVNNVYISLNYLLSLVNLRLAFDKAKRNIFTLAERPCLFSQHEYYLGLTVTLTCTSTELSSLLILLIWLYLMFAWQISLQSSFNVMKQADPLNKLPHKGQWELDRQSVSNAVLQL